MDNLIWCDIETTGLEATRCSIIEVAFLMTDNELNELDHYESVIAREPSAGWDDIALTMHTANGLFESLNDAPSMQTVQAAVVSHLNVWIGTPDAESTPPPLCGSSVHFDRTFLKYQMPVVEGMFHYRNIDVSTVKELCQRWAPAIWEARPSSDDATHRALDDIRASVAELKYYIDNGFIRPMMD